MDNLYQLGDVIRGDAHQAVRQVMLDRTEQRDPVESVAESWPKYFVGAIKMTFKSTLCKNRKLLPARWIDDVFVQYRKLLIDFDCSCQFGK